MEDIQSKFEQVLGGHAALDKKFDEKIDDLANGFSDFRKETRANFKAVFDYLSRIKEVAQIKLVMQKWQR